MQDQIYPKKEYTKFSKKTDTFPFGTPMHVKIINASKLGTFWKLTVKENSQMFLCLQDENMEKKLRKQRRTKNKKAMNSINQYLLDKFWIMKGSFITNNAIYREKKRKASVYRIKKQQEGSKFYSLTSARQISNYGGIFHHK